MARFLLAAALLAALIIPVVAETALAAATCDERPATLLGTNGEDVLRGTPGADVIVGLDGDDTILGRGGRDRICGGDGKDTIDGGGGNDRVFGGRDDDIVIGGTGHDDLIGSRGDDFIQGEGGNDFIDGAAGTDDCTQGAGTGDIKRCERADLRVEVAGPESVSEGEALEFLITVTNLGPDPTAYQLAKVNDEHDASCDGVVGGVSQRPKLQAGQQHQEVHSQTCTVEGFNPNVSLTVTVAPRARDRRLGNNQDESTTLLVPN